MSTSLLIWLSPFAFVGICLLCWHVLTFTYTVAVYANSRLLKLGLKLPRLIKRYPGRWALVTGATDGIGQSYAVRLASYGYNVVIVGRNPGKLTTTAAVLKRTNAGIDVRTVVMDFSDSSPDLYSAIAKQTEDIDVIVLVNNVGVSYEKMMSFERIPKDTELYRQLINVNVNSVVHMSRIFVNRMLKLDCQCYVINVSSYGGEIGAPFLIVYAASKAFVTSMTKCLQNEFRYRSGVNVKFQCLVPIYVATKMARVRRHNFLVPHPDSYTDEAIGTVGFLSKAHGCLSHYIQSTFLSIIPFFFQYWFLRLRMNKWKLKEIV